MLGMILKVSPVLATDKIELFNGPLGQHLYHTINKYAWGVIHAAAYLVANPDPKILPHFEAEITVGHVRTTPFISGPHIDKRAAIGIEFTNPLDIEDRVLEKLHTLGYISDPARYEYRIQHVCLVVAGVEHAMQRLASE